MTVFANLTIMEAHELSIELEVEYVRNKRCQEAILALLNVTKNDSDADQEHRADLLLDCFSLVFRNEFIREQLDEMEYPVADDFSEEGWRKILKSENDKIKRHRQKRNESQEDESFYDSFQVLYQAEFRIDRIKERMTGEFSPL